jgi:hypothetical protein
LPDAFTAKWHVWQRRVVVHIVGRKQLVDDGEVAPVELGKPVSHEGLVLLGGHGRRSVSIAPSADNPIPPIIFVAVQILHEVLLQRLDVDYVNQTLAEVLS